MFVFNGKIRTSVKRTCPIYEGGDFTYFVNCIMCDCIKILGVSKQGWPRHPEVCSPNERSADQAFEV